MEVLYFFFPFQDYFDYVGFLTFPHKFQDPPVNFCKKSLEILIEIILESVDQVGGIKIIPEP